MGMLSIMQCVGTDRPEPGDSPKLLQFSMETMVLFSHFGRATGLLARPLY